MDGPIRNILTYVDGTEESITAAQYAICLSRSTGAHLLALYVINTRALTDLVKARIFLKIEQEEYQRDLQADAERYLNHVRALAQQKNVVLEAMSVNGSVHQEIRNVVNSRNIDLLIIGGLSRIRSRRDEFYAESERAMRNVSCSVLIVKDPDRVWKIYESLV